MSVVCVMNILALQSNGTPPKVSVAWVFATTRSPVRDIFENLESGAAVAT